MIDVSSSIQISSNEDMKGGEEVGNSRLGLDKTFFKKCCFKYEQRR